MQTLIRNSIETARFEFLRSMTVQRLGVAVVMVGFSPAMLFILLMGGGDDFRYFVMMATLFMVCLLSLLLWATPNVHVELESKSWTFVTSRPSGRLAILFGKFLTSSLWAFVVCWLAMTLCLVETLIIGDAVIDVAEFDQSQAALVTQQSMQQDAVVLPQPDAKRIVDELGHLGRDWIVFTVLAALAATVYAAIFSFIGVVFHRRAMVFAAAYALVVEFLLSFLPANISKITARYHLQGLAIEWLGFFIPANNASEARAGFDELFGSYPPYVHILAILLIAAIMLAFSAVVIRYREYITADEA